MVTTKPWQLVQWKKNKELWLKDNDKCVWCGSTEDIIPHHLHRHKSKEEYMSLKCAVPLCKKCHFNLHKGNVLCNRCKKHYHNQRWEQCWYCLKEERPDFKTKVQIEEEEVAEFEEDMGKDDEKLFNIWICKDCKFIQLYSHVDSLGGACQNASCLNPKKLSAELKELEKEGLKKKRIKEWYEHIKKANMTLPVAFPLDEFEGPDIQSCKHKEAKTT